MLKIHIWISLIEKWNYNIFYLLKIRFINIDTFLSLKQTEKKKFRGNIKKRFNCNSLIFNLQIFDECSSFALPNLIQSDLYQLLSIFIKFEAFKSGNKLKGSFLYYLTQKSLLWQNLFEEKIYFVWTETTLRSLLPPSSKKATPKSKCLM